MIIANQAGEYASSIPVVEHFYSPDDLETEYLLDYEQGPVALNDPSEGLQYQSWTLRYYTDTGDFVIEAPNTAPTIIHNVAGVTQLSLAFDQNGNPFIAYVANDVAKYHWFDPAIPGDTDTNLPANSLTPRCCTDDKRYLAAEAAVSDVILMYVLNDNLYARWERDRYTVQYPIEVPFLHPRTGNPAVLKRVGMNKLNRLQWIGTDPTITSPC